MKWCPLILLFMSGLTYSQWRYEDIEVLKESCLLDISKECVEETTYSIRINLGLYSLEQLPILLELEEHQRTRGQYEDALETSYRMSWLVFKNDNRGANELMLNLIWLPDLEGFCFERSGYIYTSWSVFCKGIRYYVADRYILAVNLATRMEEWEAVVKLAGYAAFLVEGITGEAETTLEISDDLIYRRPNMAIPERYLSDKYTRIAREAENKL